MIPQSSSTSPGQNLKVEKSQEYHPQAMNEPITKESGLIKPIVLSSFHPSLKLRQQEIIDELYGSLNQDNKVGNNQETLPQSTDGSSSKKRKIENMETNSMAPNESDHYIKSIVLSSFHPSLKLRQQRIIDQLYDLKAYQCSNCGLRFPEYDPKEIQDHKDWHFKVNMDQCKWNVKKTSSKSRVW